MPWLLFALFVVVPLTEIALFITVGQRVGLIATIVLVIFTAILGSILLQRQGLSTLMRTQQAMAEGRVPMDSVIDGVCLLFAGAFLLTPGFLTDGIGFLLFVPWFRRALAKWVFKRLMASKSVQFDYFDGTNGQGSGPFGQGGQRPDDRGTDHRGPIIDGDYKAKEEDGDASDTIVPQTPRKDSPWRDDENKG